MRSSLLKYPSAFIPVAMSVAALALVLVYVATFGIVQQADEGTPAHVFQLLIVGQVPVVAFFALKWLPQAPRRAVPVLALQAAAAVLAIAIVVLLEL
ncbi:MAG: hypothetical protein ABIQ52_13975 [Vicinamibacterales bacterium]